MSVVTDDNFSVDDDGVETSGIGVRGGVGCVFLEACRIKNVEVGKEPGFNQAAILEPEGLGRERSHSPDGIFESEIIFLLNVFLEDSDVVAIPAGVWDPRVELTARSVASDHCIGVGHECFDVLFIHPMKYPARTTVELHPKDCFNLVIES